VSRVLRDLGIGTRALGEADVLNDEAQHCYQTSRSKLPRRASGKVDAEVENATPRLGCGSRLQAINRRVGLRGIYELSARFYLALATPRASSSVDGQRLLAHGRIESGIVRSPGSPSTTTR